ncbi:MAG: hypothetical protein U0871_07160 [Gemmataceae bacterium]
MRLATIRESRHDRSRQEPADADTVPQDAGEAGELFEQGMRAMRAREDATAFRIFSRVCRYRGDDAPPGLMSSARAARDYLDPDRSPHDKAETLFHFFSPSLVRLDFVSRDPAPRV